MLRLDRRLAAGIVATVALLFVGYLLMTFVEVWRAARDDGARPSDAIVVLGAAQYDGRPTPVFRARLDHAAALYRAGVAPVVVVTGGKQPGDRYTEAGSGAAYLHRLGIPDRAILRETTSHTSWQSLAASARFLKQRGMTRVVLVSDPFHSLRIKLIAEELGLDPATSPTTTSPIQGLAEWRRFVLESGRVAFGRALGFHVLDRASRVGKLVPGLAILSAPSGVV